MKHKKLNQYLQSMKKGELVTKRQLTKIDATNNQFIAKSIKNKKLFPIINNIYQKPNYNKKFKQFVPPSLMQIAKAIAIQNNETITLTENCALNALSLSTQVPMQLKFVTSGETRTVIISDNTKIQFIHQAFDYNYKNASDKIRTAIEAIKYLSKHDTELSASVIQTLCNQLSFVEIQQIISLTNLYSPQIKHNVCLIKKKKL